MKLQNRELLVKIGVFALCLALGGLIYGGWRHWRPHPPPGLRIGSPPSPANPAERARQDLERAYEQLRLTGPLLESSAAKIGDWRLKTLMKRTLALYAEAGREYQSGSHARAGAEARACASVALGLQRLVESLAGADPPQELTPGPPPPPSNPERQAYDDLAEARRGLQALTTYTPLITDPEEQNVLTLTLEVANRAYHQAADAIGSKRFDAAARLAQAVRLLAETAEHLGAEPPLKPGPPGKAAP